MDSLPWLNTAKYSAPMLLLYGVGCALWAVAYMGTLAKIRSRRLALRNDAKSIGA